LFGLLDDAQDPGRALTAAGRPAAGLRRWTPSAGLLVAAATAATLWTQWHPTAPPPAAQLATTAGSNQAAPTRAASGGQPSRRTLLPNSVTVDPALRQADRRTVEQATILLYRLGDSPNNAQPRSGAP
jgi:hypothetical protein